MFLTFYNILTKNKLPTLMVIIGLLTHPLYVPNIWDSSIKAHRYSDGGCGCVVYERVADRGGPGV